MPFQFLTYLQPTHYFRLFKTSGGSAFPQVEGLPEPILTQLEEDWDYESARARAYDLSWQALQKGYIGTEETYTHFDVVPLVDAYRFVRKYFHPAWAFYVLVLRVLSLHPPFKELSAWAITRSVKRTPYYKEPVVYPEWATFNSGLLTSSPKVSVVIPTLNRYGVLKDVLTDLEQQDYPNFEVIVVDQSDDFSPVFYEAFHLDLQLIRQEEKALWLARNTAIRQATGTLIALSEDDVRIGPDWLSQHIKALDFFKAQVSAGVFYPEGHSLPKARSFFAMATQFATGNAMLYKQVFREVGLFDRQFEKQRMGDGEFGLRVYLAGIKSISNPFASCVDVKAPTGGLRELGSWDAFRPTHWLAPRPIPSVTYFFRRYFGARATRLALLRLVPLSLFSYRLKKNKVALALSFLLAVLLLPVVVIQVYKSWYLAGKKLEQGPLIESLK